MVHLFFVRTQPKTICKIVRYSVCVPCRFLYPTARRLHYKDDARLPCPPGALPLFWSRLLVHHLSFRFSLIFYVSSSDSPSVHAVIVFFFCLCLSLRRLRSALRMVAAETEVAASSATGASPIGGPLRIGMFGGGTVGGGVYEICEQAREERFRFYDTSFF